MFKCGCKPMFDSLKLNPKLVSQNEGKWLETKQSAIIIFPSNLPLVINYFPLILSHR